MKKIIAMVAVILTLSLGMAQAEGCNVNYAAGVLKNTSRTELTELQDEAAAKCGDMDINVQLIETNPVSVGQAKYQSREEKQRSWFQKTVDWLTFWD